MRLQPLLPLLLLCCALSACGSAEEIQESFNPMPTIWGNIKDNIDRLEKSEASPEQWAQASGTAESVKGNAHMMELIMPVDLDSAERASLLQRGKSSPEIHHYGFEGNFHALVFFNRQRKPAHVFRW